MVSNTPAIVIRTGLGKQISLYYEYVVVMNSGILVDYRLDNTLDT